MKCARCTHQNTAGVMFSNTCGQMMGALCPGCKTVNPPQNNFPNQFGQFFRKTNASYSDQELSNLLFPDVWKSNVYFEFDAQVPFKLKGVAAPIQEYKFISRIDQLPY